MTRNMMEFGRAEWREFVEEEASAIVEYRQQAGLSGTPVETFIVWYLHRLEVHECLSGAEDAWDVLAEDISAAVQMMEGRE